MKHAFLLWTLLCLFTLTASAQRIVQPLGRGVVAATDPAGTSVTVTWRRLAGEPEHCTYNLYCRTAGTATYHLVNAKPLTTTCYSATRTVIPYGSELAVTLVADGRESEKSAPFQFKQHAWRSEFFDFDFDSTVLTPNNYRAKYAWPMDTDGDGETDAVLVDRQWAGGAGDDPTLTGAAPNDNFKLQAYRLDGTLLWTIDIGPNKPVDLGSNDGVLAYDINGDGRCEVIFRSSDGTRFWDSKKGTYGLYANHSLTADTDQDGITDYRKQSKRNAPYYVSVVDALTGEEIDCAELDYSALHDGSDQYSRDNRADYKDDGEGTEYAFLSSKFAICYFDGIHPSLAVECYNRRNDNGHHYYVLAWDYDWQSGRAQRWHHSYTWSRNDKSPWPAEFHQLRVADVDGDGIDEMLDGGFAVNPVKGMVMNAAIGHGDRYDVSDIDPERPGLEVFAIQQSALLGQLLYDARTGEHIREWYLPSIADVGRGRCMDVDAAHKGYEVFSTMGGLYDCRGDLIKDGATAYPVEGIWWDGDLQRELIGSPGGSGFGTNVMVTKYDGTRLIQFSKESGWAVECGTAVRPAFMGDMTGDWREELILMKQSNDHSTGLVGYTTDIATDVSLYCLQQDPHYRGDCTTRGYYQMPCTGFYLGSDMPAPPLPPMIATDLRYSGSGAWAVGQSAFTTYAQTATAPYADGKSVMFDMSTAATAVQVTSALRPSATYVMMPSGRDLTFSGEGALEGTGDVWKSAQGSATFDIPVRTTGHINISEGTLTLCREVSSDISLRAKGTLAGTGTLLGAVTFEAALNREGCRIKPGTAAAPYSTLRFGRDLTLPGDVNIELNAASSRCASIDVAGALTFKGRNTIIIDRTDGTLPEGDYVLATCSGVLTAATDQITVLGLEGLKYTLHATDHALTLSVHDTRAAEKNVVWTGQNSGAWDYQTDNFAVQSAPTSFVSGDEVRFDDTAAKTAVTLDGTVMPAAVTFANDQSTYTLTGDGAISGATSLTKRGSGEVKMLARRNDFTGAVHIDRGTLTVPSLADGGQASPLGAASAAAGNLTLDRGTLKITSENTATDRVLTLTDTATINVSNARGSVSLKGAVRGAGTLVKAGAGQLNFAFGGENAFGGLILRGGTVAQGAWNSTFGRSGSPMRIESGTVSLIGNNNSSTRPVFNHRTTIPASCTATINGTTRGAINGSFAGSGTLTIVSSGVRSDIGANFSAFDGTLHAAGSNFRLMSSVTDMKRTAVVADAGAFIGHFSSNGGTQESVTTHIGSLASTATDCTIGHANDSYEIGYLGTDCTYKGALAARKITKRGTGTWTLTGSSSTSPITVADGVLQLYTQTTPVTSGLITVAQGGTLTGTGAAGNVTVSSGGTLTSGYNGRNGTLRLQGSTNMRAGSTLHVHLTLRSTGTIACDKFQLTGTLTHASDTLLIDIDPKAEVEAGAEYAIITGSGTQSGTYHLAVRYAGHDITIDDSDFLTTGKIRVASVTATGVRGVNSDAATVDVRTADGLRIRSAVPRDHALDGLPRGIYIVGDEKMMKQ